MATCGLTPPPPRDPELHALGPACWLTPGHTGRHRFRTESDHPALEVGATVEGLLAENKRIAIFQKFTCEWCGARQSMDVPNVLYMTATCEECRQVTDIVEAGCNFWMINQIAGDPVALERMLEVIKDEAGGSSDSPGRSN